MPVEVFDFFSGCGGTSKGLLEAGCNIAFGLDKDPHSAQTFRTNFPEAHFIEQKIQDVPTDAIADLYAIHQVNPILFCGCAPCQPFSSQGRYSHEQHESFSLLSEFGRFVRHYQPDFVLVENVPGLQSTKLAEKGPLAIFINLLEELGYSFDLQTVYCETYGIPQRRKRLVLLAQHDTSVIYIPEGTHGPGKPNPEYATVSMAIQDLPPLMAGETHAVIPNHQCATLSERNIQRIVATPMGGGRQTWPDELILECHQGEYEGHTDVYGRLHWDKPAVTLTSKCHSLSNGRFGHPEQHRAISMREAARLQSFPDDFTFSGGLHAVARQIGNAVPPLLAQQIGQRVIDIANIG